MTVSHAILAGFSLIALAIGAAGVAGRAGASAPDNGRYATAAASNFYTVLDTVTGDVRVCIVNGSCQDYRRQ